MKFFNKFSLIFIFLTLIFSKALSIENKILFKVNNDIITSMDIMNEIEYLKLLNQNLLNLEREKLFEIAKNSLVREKIKKIQLSKFFETLEVEQEYFDFYINEFIKKTKLASEEELKIFVTSNGMDIKNIEQKIKIEILWNQIIINRFSKDIKINKKKIKEDLIKNNLQKEYLLSEIVFNLKDESINEKFKKIKDEIKNNGFENAASIYSISTTSNKGGKLGWIKFNSLNEKIKAEILNTEIEKYTNPVVIPGGFVILKIEDQRESKLLKILRKK